MQPFKALLSGSIKALQDARTTRFKRMCSAYTVSLSACVVPLSYISCNIYNIIYIYIYTYIYMYIYYIYIYRRACASRGRG